MRKFIYSLFVVLALSCTFVSCSDDDDDAPTPAGDPAVAAAGTYNGTWTITLDTVSVTAPGSLTLSATDTAYVTEVVVKSDDFNIKVGTSNSTRSVDFSDIANISFAGDANSFLFANATGANLGNFAGRISNGNATITFSKSERIRRRNYTLNYSFTGTK